MKARLMVPVTVALVLASGAACAGLFVYPANGQSAQQQQQDQADCYVWARNQVGFDPAYGAPQSPPPDQNQNLGKGLFGGALLGGLVGAATHGNMGESVGIGMLMGGVLGHSRDQQQQAQQAQQSQSAAMQQFNNAESACLRGRGYTVSP
jgi:hypothetical protein